jgi:hypothetical protein
MARRQYLIPSPAMGMARPTPYARETCPPTINADTTQPGTALPCGPRRSIHRAPPEPPRQRAHPLSPARWFDAGVLADPGGRDELAHRS